MSDDGILRRGARRRRMRYLQRLRELQLRDLGGLVFELHRQGTARDELVAGKLEGLDATDAELRRLERELGERRPEAELREPGVGGECPRCGVLYGSLDRYCSGCALDLEAVRTGAYASGTAAR